MKSSPALRTLSTVFLAAIVGCSTGPEQVIAEERELTDPSVSGRVTEMISQAELIEKWKNELSGHYWVVVVDKVDGSLLRAIINIDGEHQEIQIHKVGNEYRLYIRERGIEGGELNTSGKWHDFDTSKFLPTILQTEHGIY
jgi:hypothetical protein